MSGLIMLASWVLVILMSFGSYPATALAANVTGFMNQLEAAYLNGVPRFFHQTKNRFDETDGTQFGLSENWYTATKSMAEIAAFWARKSRKQLVNSS